jgi:hypothetical protein
VFFRFGGGRPGVRVGSFRARGAEPNSPRNADREGGRAET